MWEKSDFFSVSLFQLSLAISRALGAWGQLRKRLTSIILMTSCHTQLRKRLTSITLSLKANLHLPFRHAVSATCIKANLPLVYVCIKCNALDFQSTYVGCNALPQVHTLMACALTLNNIFLYLTSEYVKYFDYIKQDNYFRPLLKHVLIFEAAGAVVKIGSSLKPNCKITISLSKALIYTE